MFTSANMNLDYFCRVKHLKYNLSPCPVIDKMVQIMFWLLWGYLFNWNVNVHPNNQTGGLSCVDNLKATDSNHSFSKTLSLYLLFHFKSQRICVSQMSVNSQFYVQYVRAPFPFNTYLLRVVYSCIDGWWGMGNHYNPSLSHLWWGTAESDSQWLINDEDKYWQSFPQHYFYEWFFKPFHSFYWYKS